MDAPHPYERLWDGSEPGWVVVRRTEDREQLTLEFGSSGPTLDEVKALRTLQSDYRSRPVGEVLASLRGKSSLFLGTFESREARSLKKRCAEVGLQVTAIGARWVSLNLINRLSSTFLLIEDDREIGEVAEEAIRRGVPVEESTT